MDQVSTPPTVAKLGGGQPGAGAASTRSTRTARRPRRSTRTCRCWATSTSAEFTRLMAGDHRVGGAGAGLRLLPRRRRGPQLRHALHQGGGAPDAPDDAAHQRRLADRMSARPASPATPAIAASRARRTSGSTNPGPAAARASPAIMPGRTRRRVPAALHRCRTIRSRRSSSRTTTSACVSTTALPDGNRKSIKQTEWTYALMMHISEGAGRELHLLPQQPLVLAWDQSTPARATAWYGIRMVRDLNTDYLDPLHGGLPAQPAGPARRRRRRSTAPPATRASTSRCSASAC